MGTLGMLFALQRHWRTRSHPVYKIQQRFSPLSPGEAVRAVLKRAAAIVSILFFVFTLLVGLVWLVSAGSPVSLVPALVVVGIIPLVLPALAFLAIFLWPVGAAMATSRVIVAEREASTWDILLTIPLDWQEIILAKEAAALQSFPPQLFVILWSLASALTMFVTTALGPTAAGSDGLGSLIAATLMLPILVIVGFQVYLWAGLIGLLASLFSSNRQMALTVASVASFSVNLFTGLIVTLGGQVVMFILTGLALPTFTVKLSAIGLVIVILACLNDLLIRIMFRSLVRHLGGGQVLLRSES